jgi:hypothetical protein
MELGPTSDSCPSSGWTCGNGVQQVCSSAGEGGRMLSQKTTLCWWLVGLASLLPAACRRREQRRSSRAVEATTPAEGPEPSPAGADSRAVVVADARIAALKPETTRVSIHVPPPGKGLYNLFCGEHDFGRPPGPHDLRVPQEQMEGLLRALSDTGVFQWEPMTADGPPLPCVLIYGGTSFEIYQCGLASVPQARIALNRVISPLGGDARRVLSNVADSLQDETEEEPSH